MTWPEADQVSGLFLYVHLRIEFERVTAVQYNCSMDTTKRFVWTVCYRVTMGMTTLSSAVFLMFTTPILFPWRDRVVDATMRVWARISLASANAKVVTHGLDHVPESPPYIIAFNHQSDLDIFALVEGLPQPYRAVMKREMMYYPVVGWVIYFLGFVPIDRRNLDRAVQSLKRAARMFHRFPYIMAITGTRVRNRDFLRVKLKKGPVVTAIQHKVPILPVTIIGADDVHVKGIGLINPGRTIELVVHPLMDSGGRGVDERDAWLAELREVLAGPLLERRIIDAE